MTAPLIALEDITFAYPGSPRPVLENFSFQLWPGQKLGIVGPNGSGKTTLLLLIMGLLRPQQGRVIIFGQERRREKDFLPVRQQIGLLFQNADDQLFCPTVLEDVAFGPLNQGKSVAEAKAIALETLNRLGIPEFADRLTYKLSGGEKKLVSLATVLAMQPQILLLDEPTNGLDEATQQRIVAILRSLELSYVVVSHEKQFLRQTVHHCCQVDGRCCRPFQIFEGGFET